jgi:diphosphomevalonate decarboxylase/isopentenyl-diphosphate delta-isomerase, type 1
MNPTQKIVTQILSNRWNEPKKQGMAFAPVNFALIKYWGKRDLALNLPVTSSLSLTLPEKGAWTRISLIDAQHDECCFNQQTLSPEHPFFAPIRRFLDYFRTENAYHFRITTQVNLPPASGLATSACGFAALTLALNDLFGWELGWRELSILARLGSGSACRSLWSGFVEWHAGTREDGMDSYAEPLSDRWDDLCIGLLILHPEPKAISSRIAMQHTMATSCYYPAWEAKVPHDIVAIKQAIKDKNFAAFGQICENSALAMHATLLTSCPPIAYWTPHSLAAIQTIWQLRQDGLPLYFTQDAGANLKLLFLNEQLAQMQAAFPSLEIAWPFTPPRLIDHVVLVDETDKAIGSAEKLAAHQNGACHRAFSVFVFRYRGKTLELLLQQRQHHKYHCGGLWTNTCCSHPRPGESLSDAAQRRLREELGITATLGYQGYFHYRAACGHDLMEHEVDHVFVSYVDPSVVTPHPEEVADVRWMSVDALQAKLIENPSEYTPWLKAALKVALGG